MVHHYIVSMSQPDMPDVAKSVTVAAPLDEAFRIFVERPIEWLPPGHTFIRDPQAITIEPRAGGRFYERGADGAEITRGTVVAWAPPRRLVLTWRVGANWRPVDDDERASRIRLEFTAAGPGTTLVVLTHTELHRHGEAAATIRSAVDAPGPGDTLARYAETVLRHTPTAGEAPKGGRAST